MGNLKKIVPPASTREERCQLRIDLDAYAQRLTEWRGDERVEQAQLEDAIAALQTLVTVVDP